MSGLGYRLGLYLTTTAGILLGALSYTSDGWWSVAVVVGALWAFYVVFTCLDRRQARRDT